MMKQEHHITKKNCKFYLWGHPSQVKREERKRSKEREENKELMEQKMHFCVGIIVVYHIM